MVDEGTIARAHDLARKHTGIQASATGTAGLAGAMSLLDGHGSIALIFSGVER